MEEEDNYLRLLPDTKCHNPNPNIYHSTLCNLQWVSNHTRRENSKCTLTWPDTLSMLVDTLSWWVGSWWYRYWTLWLRAMSISVVLYISYTLVGPTTEPRPLATGIVLLAGAIDRKTLFLRWRRRMIVRTILIVIMFFVSTLVVCPITLLVPCDARVHKLAGSINECTHSWSRCEGAWSFQFVWIYYMVLQLVLHSSKQWWITAQEITTVLLVVPTAHHLVNADILLIPDNLTPAAGVCTFINGSCKFVNPCITWNKECYGTDYQCTDKEHYHYQNCSYYHPPPPPKEECLPINGTCQQYNPCRKWPGFCGGPYQCITDIQYYRYTHGPQPECPVPVPPRPNPPGECIYQHGQCVWSSKCTFAVLSSSMIWNPL